MRTIRLAVLAVVLAVSAAACGSDGTDASAGSDDNSGGAGEVSITKAWARTSPASAENGAAYMVLRSEDGDTLQGVAAPASVAKTVELHETVKNMAGASTTMAAGGATTMAAGGATTTMAGSMSETMSMQPIEELALPKGEDVVLEPGGYHIMLVGLTSPLEAGQKVTLTLTFAKAGTQTIEVPVQTSAP